MILRQKYLDDIKLFLNKPFIKVLTGMRRVGKSTLLMLLSQDLIKSGIPQKNIVYVNMESLEFEFIKDYKELNKYVTSKLEHTKGKKYILIDEVQEIGKWEKAISSFLADNMGDIIITGSNAHLLSSELSTLITGRYVEIPIFPLSFKEFIEFRSKNGKKLNVEDYFKLFIRYGGLPGIHFLPMKDEAVFPYLNSILNTIVLKDVVKRHDIRDVAHLERILDFVMDNCGNITTSKSIADYLKSQKTKITVDTVQNYLEYLTQAFIIHKLKRFNMKGKRYLEFYYKYFMGDIGLRHGIAGFKDQSIAGILENVVFLELMRRNYKVSIGISDGSEIDFIAENQNEKLYFQVCYLLSDKKTVEREFGNLEKIKDNYPKTVLSLDKFWTGEHKGIKHQNIMDFLLE